MINSQYKIKNTGYSLTIGWLYPELMNTYGDRGNITVLQKRCEWREIKVQIEQISVETSDARLAKCDMLFMGGAQDTQQEVVNRDLFERKGSVLKKKIEQGIPGLFICGAYQFLGKYYKTADGKKLPGLEFFPCYTENPGGNARRLIGNIIIEPTSDLRFATSRIVGFENHGGRTYLEDKSMAFAKVIKGFGNNGEDKTEGIIYKNSIGTYLHGPILPKNPEIADWLIKKALEIKLGGKTELKLLNDTLEQEAKEAIVKRILT